MKMSREHLYKAKHIDTGIWFEGDLIHDIDNFGERRTCIYQALGKGHWQTVHVDDSTVCKYVGLEDLEIWTNDICTFFDITYRANLTGVVRFGKYNQDDGEIVNSQTPVIGFYVEIIKCQYAEDGFFDDEYIELNNKISVLEAVGENNYENFKCIGNLFDNPELLKGDDE